MEGIPTSPTHQKRKYCKKTQLAILQHKKYKKYIPAVIAPTVEFKSFRQLQCEKRQRKNDSCSEYSFKLHVPSLEHNTCMAAPPVQVTSPNSSADEAETDYYSDGDHSSTPSSYVQACIREMSDSNILTTVLHKCEDHGLTRHFMCLIKQIASGNLPVTNMAFCYLWKLLCCIH